MIEPLLLALVLAPFGAGDTVALSLDDAVARARAANPTLAAVRAEAEAAGEVALSATRGFLPTVELGLGGVRTTDPVGVFGLKLRQSGFTMGDLALDALNRPDPYGGYTSTATVTVPLLAPEGLFGHAGAKRAAAAQAAMADRAAGATTFRVIEAYWSSHLAQQRVETLAAALTAARAHVSQAEALYAQGLVTGLDARVARVRAAELETARLAAEADAANALAALAVLVGLPIDTPLRLTDAMSLDVTAACGEETASCTLEDRADLAAAAHAEAAASAASRRAWSTNLPSLAVFGSIAYHARTAPWADGSDDWTIGFQVNWSIFTGLGGVGAVRGARAQHEAAVARARAAREQAQLEAAAARRSLAAAQARTRVAAAAAAEAREALAQAEVRYAQGTAPIAELLDVQAAATASFLNQLATRRDLFVAQAALDFAYGVFDQ